MAAAEPVTQREREVASIAEVADGGDSRGESLQGGLSHSEQQGCVIVGPEMGDGVERGVERQMLVGVDESRQEGGVAEVDDIRPRQRRATRPDVEDPAILDLDHPVVERLRGSTVEQSTSREQHRAPLDSRADGQA